MDIFVFKENKNGDFIQQFQLLFWLSLLMLHNINTDVTWTILMMYLSGP